MKWWEFYECEVVGMPLLKKRSVASYYEPHQGAIYRPMHKYIKRGLGIDVVGHRWQGE